MALFRTNRSETIHDDSLAFSDVLTQLPMATSISTGSSFEVMPGCHGTRATWVLLQSIRA